MSSQYGTKFTETEALLAALSYDEDYLRERLEVMTQAELWDLQEGAERMSSFINEVIEEGTYERL